MADTVAENKWLVRLDNSTNADLNLYCFPYAGGSSNIFRRWPLYVPPKVKVIPVELPGHGKRLTEAPITDLKDIVMEMGASFGSELREPFAFYGHSMGALLAFELTHYLGKHDLPLPRQLFVSAHLAPHKSADREVIYDLPEDDFVRQIHDLNGTPTEVLQNKELRDLFLPILRADFQVCETYNYHDHPTLDIPITAFCGEDDADVTPSGMEEWRNHTLESFQLEVVSGGHFFIHSEEQRFHHILREKIYKLLLTL